MVGRSHDIVSVWLGVETAFDAGTVAAILAALGAAPHVPLVGLSDIDRAVQLHAHQDFFLLHLVLLAEQAVLDPSPHLR